MNAKYPKMIPTLTVLLLFVLLGGPQMTLAQSSAAQNQPTVAEPATGAQPQQTTTERTGTTEPPAPLPEAPSAQRPVGTPALPQSAQPTKQQQEQAPLGAAAAQKGETAGGAASKPAGMAIAPAKQRQVRSFLLKLGLVAAGAAAIGTVVALTRGTSSVPPGAPR